MSKSGFEGLKDSLKRLADTVISGRTTALKARNEAQADFLREVEGLVGPLLVEFTRKVEALAPERINRGDSPGSPGFPGVVTINLTPSGTSKEPCPSSLLSCPGLYVHAFAVAGNFVYVGWDGKLGVYGRRLALESDIVEFRACPNGDLFSDLMTSADDLRGTIENCLAEYEKQRFGFSSVADSLRALRATLEQSL